MGQFYLVGRVIAVKLNYRADDPRRLNEDWFEGHIWCYDTSSQLSSSSQTVRVLVPRQGLAWYQALPTKSSNILEFGVFARVEEDGSGGTLLRLMGTRIGQDKDGI